MTKEEISIVLQARETVRKGLGQLRETGVIPAVIHNHGKESILIQGDEVELSKIYVKAGKSQPVTLKVGKDEHLTIIKDVDISPTKNRLRHVVFQAIRKGEKVNAEVGVSFRGEAPAQQKGLMVLQQITMVEIAAIPSKLPEVLYVDATKLAEEGDNIHVSDIEVPEGVEILTLGSNQIAVVEVPKDQEAEADAAAAELAEDADAPAEVPSEQGGDDEASEGTESTEEKPDEDSKD